MTETAPSFTALTAAAARAAHLIVDHQPTIFADTLAERLLGELAGDLIGYHRQQPRHPILSAARAQVSCRSRYAEDQLSRSGITQYIVLGAGLDTFACRSAGIRVFEVDQPGTQAWKRAALTAAGIAEPDHVRFVPVDLRDGGIAAADETLGGGSAAEPVGIAGRSTLLDRLAAAGLDLAAPALVAWLGVTLYLDQPAIEATLAALSGLAPGSQLVVDYMLPAGDRDEDGDSYTALIAPVAAERGEPWRTFLTPADVAGLLARHGFTVTAQLTQAESVPAGLWRRTDSLRPIALSMIATATLR